jgi:ketosteroid isomerase-like protein
MSPNKQVVERYMEAYTRWDHGAILELLTEDVEWLLPGAFHHRGKAAFDAEIEGICNPGPPAIVVSRYVEEGDVVVAEGRVRQPTADGEVRLVFVDIFEMRGGKIAKLISYLMQDNEEKA